MTFDLDMLVHLSTMQVKFNNCHRSKFKVKGGKQNAAAAWLADSG